MREKALKFSTQPNRSKDNEFCPCGKSNKDNKFCSFVGFEEQGKGHCFACDKTFFPDKENGTAYTIDKPIKPKKRPDYKKTGQYLSDYTSPLHSFMQQFAQEDLSTHFEKYLVGTAEYNRTVFGIADSTGDIVNLKYFDYQTNGKRDQSKSPHYTKDCERCLYGLHLYDSAKPAIIVESEKTAQALGLYFDNKYNFLATGGANGSKKEHFLPLIGNEVYYFCDNDIAGRKNKNIDYLRELHNENQIQLKIIDAFTREPAKYDLADYLFENRQNKTAESLKQWIEKASFAPKPKPEPEPKNRQEILPTQNTPTESQEQEAQEEPAESHHQTTETPTIIKVENYLSYKYIFRRNIITGEVEHKAKKGNNSFVITNSHDVVCELLRLGFKNIKDIVTSLLNSSFIPEYNPITDYFESLASYNPETDKDYITQLAHFVTFDKPKEKQRFAIALKKHLVRTIKQVFEKGYYNKQGLIIVGEVQDTGKTSYIEFLVPPPFKGVYARKDLPHPEIKNKDNKFALAKYMIINLDELKSYRQDQTNAIKALFSLESITERNHHDKTDTRLKRIASFFGSTNNTDFLTDETGSVRWLCFGNVTKIDFSYRQKIDINKVWSQAWHLFNNNFDCEVSADEKEESEAINRENYSDTSIEEELLLLHYEPHNRKDKLYFKTTTEILLQLENIANRKNLSAKKLGQALIKNNFPKGSERVANKPIKGYYVLPIKS